MTREFARNWSCPWKYSYLLLGSYYTYWSYYMYHLRNFSYFTNIHTVQLQIVIHMFTGYELPKIWWSPNIFLTKFCLLFFQLLKISFNWEIFCWLTNKEFIFSSKSKHKKADSWYLAKKYLVNHEILVIRILQTCYYIFL